MKVLSGLYYTKDHEWVKVEDETALVGVTDFAQNSLGSIVYVELPEMDEAFEVEESFGTIESVKAASDMLMPVSGTIVEVNEALDDDPSLVNTAPYENWIIKISLSDTTELDELMNAEEYEAYCNEEA
ncbi:glycine cleavage system protein GcvH [Fusibacter ferrireducens]|uniref:Glycine cleavage system H protein n=1 Tax=Fusibacter ferrireducens TaxID=2785058 RepID=A0ABR9ZTV1_9FIRM|nr:glycine cleavage system protein GcvH [Fusibacter ferrireducens]MBF4693875.1 glycine cleavage system protein GcvH [Fusibacter ferrireducens]